MLKAIAVMLLFVAGAGWHMANRERDRRLVVEARADSIAIRNACLEAGGCDCTEPHRLDGRTTPYGAGH